MMEKYMDIFIDGLEALEEALKDPEGWGHIRILDGMKKKHKARFTQELCQVIERECDRLEALKRKEREGNGLSKNKM